ncbi:CHY-type domain-containing protein [Mycena chlorophos]|uniref:CHY-type domain-containing protein n=1 Tax=Mycena chlorophos TaxID=658473 RepID=A0A8H6W4E5_MYCCL|nr:CHY-type domain-containing protein [Mycena chlorophos]
MCKHILNAQVSIRAPCCKAWFDCAECHAETQTHKLAKTAEMVFMCKKCRKAFRKDMSTYEESDEYCPHCDNHYVIDAKTPQAVVQVEGEDVRVDARMLKDDRVKATGAQPELLDDDDFFSDRLG